MDEPEKKSSGKALPTLVISVRPDTRARIKALAEHEQRPAWKIVESAVNLYFDQMSTRERHVVRTLSKKPNA